MRIRTRAAVIILPPLLALAIGWVLIVIDFAQSHQVAAVNSGISAAAYVLNFLQYWAFVLGVPVVIPLAMMYALTDNFILGIITRTLMCACAVALGACFTITSVSAFSQFGIRFRVVGLVGEALSFLSFLTLFGIMPWLLKKFADTAQKKHGDQTMAKVPL